MGDTTTTPLERVLASERQLTTDSYNKGVTDAKLQLENEQLKVQSTLDQERKTNEQEKQHIQQQFEERLKKLVSQFEGKTDATKAEHDKQIAAYQEQLSKLQQELQPHIDREKQKKKAEEEDFKSSVSRAGTVLQTLDPSHNKIEVHAKSYSHMPTVTRILEGLADYAENNRNKVHTPHQTSNSIHTPTSAVDERSHTTTNPASSQNNKRLHSDTSMEVDSDIAAVFGFM